MKKEYPKCPICGKNLPLWKHLSEPIWNEEKQRWKGFYQFCGDKCKNSEAGKKYASEKHKTACKQSRKKKNEILEKRKKTCLVKYGVDNPAKAEINKKKIKEAKLAQNHTTSNEKRKKTCLAKYGVKYSTQSKSKIEKTKETWNKKYKNGHHMRDEKYKNKIKENQLRSYFKKHIKNNEYFEARFTEDQWVETKGATIDELNILEFKCKKCGTKFKQNLWNGFSMIRCPKCNPYNITTAQLEIENFIKTYNINNIIQNTKQIITPLELDIYIPDYKLAIEYNGLAFHSFGKSKWSMINNYKDEPIRRYHLREKMNICLEKGIEVLNIFENEWIDKNKQDIWKSIILNKLNKTPNKIFARKCVIKEINNKQLIKTFLNKNHLQGECNGKINIGLFHDDELIQLVVLSKPRYNKHVEMEVLRISTKKFYNVVGGISKLFKYIENNLNISSLISYSNNRYGTGNIYNILGFKYQKESNPNYWYFKENTFNLKSRLNYQKNKLKNLFENVNESKTEKEIMFENSYRIIYDCGNKVFVWNKSS